MRSLDNLHTRMFRAKLCLLVADQRHVCTPLHLLDLECDTRGKDCHAALCCFATNPRVPSSLIPRVQAHRIRLFTLHRGGYFCTRIRSGTDAAAHRRARVVA